MTVLHLISSGGFYGAENMLIVLSAALRKRGCHNVLGVYCNARNPHTEVAEAARGLGIETVEIPCAGRWDWNSVRQTREWIGRGNVDIVHCHGYKADLYGLAAVNAGRIPVVATCHNWTRETALLRLYCWADKIALRWFDRVAVVSENVYEQLRRAGVPKYKLQRIGNGIDLDKAAHAEASLRDELPPGRRIVGAVGRLVPSKGFDVMLAAARAVVAQCPEALFVIAGEGPDRDRLAGLARNAGLEDAVRFVGARRDMPGVYRSMDVFVMPSLNEGMPMSVLEAMAAGVPVVASAVGAIPKLLQPGPAGLLVEPGDSRQLAESLLRVLSDPDWARRAGQAGRESIARSYSAEHMAAEYLSLYGEVNGRARDVFPMAGSIL